MHSSLLFKYGCRLVAMVIIIIIKKNGNFKLDWGQIFVDICQDAQVNC